jgi:hypothetical protein
VTRSNCILDVLLELAPTLNWLNQAQPISAADIPAEHQCGLKQLENLGLVYRRNSRSCGLQNERLLKMLKRESQYASAEKQVQCLSAFSLILEFKGKLDAEELSAQGNAVMQNACS